MNPGFDDHIQRMIHEQATASMRLSGEIDQTCMLLGQFRRGLIAQGFSQKGAERLAREMMVVASDTCWDCPGEDGEG